MNRPSGKKRKAIAARRELKKRARRLSHWTETQPQVAHEQHYYALRNSLRGPSIGLKAIVPPLTHVGIARQSTVRRYVVPDGPACEWGPPVDNPVFSGGIYGTYEVLDASRIAVGDPVVS